MTEKALAKTNNQNTLFRYQTTWGHYVGSQYYPTDESFIEEARIHGITRRAPFRIVKGMEFGDRVVFLRWGGKGQDKVSTFAQMVVSSITFEGEYATLIGEKLLEEGRAEYKEGGEIIERGCGSFAIMGTFTVNCSMNEIMEMAEELAKQKNESLFVMIGGNLSAVYEPVLLNPAPKFTRSFLRFEGNPSFEYQPIETEFKNKIVGVHDYRKKDLSKKHYGPRKSKKENK